MNAPAWSFSHPSHTEASPPGPSGTIPNELDTRGEERLYRALRRCWHPVSYTGDVEETPMPVVLLDVEIVLARLAGRVCAFQDRCIHCGTALSLGRIEGDRLCCASDAWTYAADGTYAGTYERQGPGNPLSARLRRYRTEEQCELVWVTLVDDPIFALPELAELDDPTYRSIKLPAYEWKCSAARRIENFVDFAHFAWIHEGILGDRDHPEVPDHDVWRGGHELRFEGAQLRLDESADLVAQSDYRIFLPFTIHMYQRLPGNQHFVLFMAASPVGRKVTRCFTIHPRDYDLDESEDSKFIQLQETILAQDKPIVESQRPEELPVDLTAELHVKGVDKVSLEYRRWLVEIANAYEGDAGS
jgi:phenylpropionate dioxygenase-like ring-hydroxylating dioxygenase large terminal subunit